jgi:ferredoxin-NADP reductase
MEKPTEYTWHLVDKQVETPQTQSLYLRATTTRPDFIAGQYLTIKLPNCGPAEGKAYSISSAPDETLVRITIKKMGTFSSALLTREIGDTITTSAPYGFFYPEPADSTPLIFLVGGIGITPVLSILKDLTNKKDPRPLYLFYSNQTERETTFKKELTELTKENPQLSIHYFITRETLVSDGYLGGRMTPDHIQRLIPPAATADYFLCGSMDFTKFLWKTLRASGIAQPQIYTEGFF